jgi:peptidoglycan/LPS O-acetylase OafA/YrhL
VLTLVSVYLVDQCVKGIKGRFGWFMSLPALMYLGTISYGLYLCHVFVMDVIGSPFSGRVGLCINVALWTIGSILLASASWFLMEKPINSLKTRIQLRPRLPAPTKPSSLLAKPGSR